MANPADNGTGRRDDAASEASQGGRLPPGPLARALRIPLRRWRLSACCLLLSAGIALVIGLAFRQKSYNVECVLVYTPPPQSEELKNVYTSSKVETLEKLIDSQDNLMALKEERQLPLSVEVLRKKIKVDPGLRSEAAVVTLTWGEPNEGADMLNRLAELHIRQVRRIRRDRTEKSVASQTASVDEAEKDLMRKKREYEEFLAAYRSLLDTRADSDEVAKALDQFNAQILDIQRKGQAAEANLRELARQLAETEAKLDWTPERQEKDLEAEGDASYLQKKRDLRNRLAEQKAVLAQAIIEVRDMEQKLLTEERLRRSGAGIPEKYAEAQANYDKACTKQLETDRAVQEVEANLRKLPAEHMRSKKTRIVEKMTDVRAEIKAGAEAVIDIEKRKKLLLEDRARRADAPGGANRTEVLARADLLKTGVEAAGKELDRRNRELTALKRLEQDDRDEVRLAVPAAAPPEAAGSNFKKLVAAAFAVSALLLFGGLIAFDKVTNQSSGLSVAERLGLPVLATLPGAAAADRPAQPQARSAALRLRQSLPDAGGILLCSPLNDDAAAEGMTFELGRCLALQGERVLILDARIGRTSDGLPAWVDRLVALRTSDLSLLERDGAGAPGLVQCLVFEDQPVGRFVRPTRVPGLDYLPAGGPCRLTDVLAAQSMRDLLTVLHRRYSLVVFLGPALAQGVDTEILAGYVNGLLVLVNPPATACTPQTEEFLRSLREADAPLAGAVLCE
jgi:hypothetical protein